MILKENKVYKITHKKFPNWSWARDYIICSPNKDIHVDETFFNDIPYRLRRSRISVPSHFIVCFDGEIILDHCTSLHSDCTVEEIVPQDYQDIRKVVYTFNAACEKMKFIVYNRKTNFIIFK